MKGHWIVYSAEELAWIEERREWPRPAMHAAFVVLFGRQDVAFGALNGLCKRNGWMTGRTGRIEAGTAPHNKGKPHPTTGRGAETQFKKGARTGKAALNWKPVGTERTSVDGYRERKIHDGLPMQSRWRLVHMIEWEAVNGPIPKGSCLKALDSDRLNTDPANWRLIPRAMLPALNGGRHKRRPLYDEAAADLKPSLLALAEVETRARQLRRSLSGSAHDASPHGNSGTNQK